MAVSTQQAGRKQVSKGAKVKHFRISIEQLGKNSNKKSTLGNLGRSK